MKTALVGLLAVAVSCVAAGTGLSAPLRASPGRPAAVRVLASAYCLRGHTASGTLVAAGTVAVDPRFIRLGSRLWIPGYGRGRALDTGGAIRGGRLDLWMSSCAAAFRWGLRSVVVTVWRH